jgi:4-amino-4-deoxy-L-arabinose transferase-like glycosyltransferase
LHANAGLTMRESHQGPRLFRWLETGRSWNSLLIIGVAVLAAVIRFWNFGSLGYQHWDELYFIFDARRVSLTWPRGFGNMGWVTVPLVAYTDGTLFHFFGINSWIPLAVSATYGTLSAVALYFLGSRLFGNAVGLIAAAILATAEFSVMFSRMAIADATFDFWLITSVLFIWLGFTHNRIVYYVLAGVSAGLLLNTKYDGVFALLLAGAWLLGEFLLDATRRPRAVRTLATDYRMRLLGTLIILGLAIFIFVPFLVKIGISPGFSTVFHHNSTNVANSLGNTTPKIIVWFFWVFTSPATVVIAVAGIVVGVVRFTRADRLLLMYTAGWFVALMFFFPYPREALSLLPAVALWAGRAIVEIWQLVRTMRPRLPFSATLAAAACGLAILIGQIVPLPQMLSLRTEGYADAGVIAARYQSTGSTIFIRTQAVALLYLKGVYELNPSPLVVRLLNEKASTVVFMTDQTLTWDSVATEKALFDLNRDRLLVIDRVPNPLYDDVLLQPATEDKLSHLDDPPDAYRYITFWRVTGPLLYPPSWPH